MRLLLLVLVLTLVAAAARADDNPFYVGRQVEVWQFQPQRTLYTYTAWVNARRATQAAIGMSTQPVWKGKRFRVRSRGDFDYVFMDRLEYRTPTATGSPQYENILAVFRPRKPMGAGQRRWVQLQIDFQSVPFLHGNPVGRRTLSLTVPPHESQQQTLIFTFPKPPTPPSQWDLAPKSVGELGGWSVYRYEAGSLERHAPIHLGFDLAESRLAPPPLEKLLPADMAGPSPGAWTDWKGQ